MWTLCPRASTPKTAQVTANLSPAGARAIAYITDTAVSSRTNVSTMTIADAADVVLTWTLPLRRVNSVFANLDILDPAALKVNKVPFRYSWPQKNRIQSNPFSFHEVPGQVFLALPSKQMKISKNVIKYFWKIYVLASKVIWNIFMSVEKVRC